MEVTDGEQDPAEMIFEEDDPGEMNENLSKVIIEGAIFPEPEVDRNKIFIFVLN